MRNTIADTTDPSKKANERVDNKVGLSEIELQSALDAIWREIQSDQNQLSQFRDEGKAAAAFAAAATELLNSVDDALFRIGQTRDKTRALLDRLESRLASSNG